MARLAKQKRIVNERLLAEVRGIRCLACYPRAQASPTEAHHVKTKGSGGHDVVHNIMALCHEHHMEVHSKGLVYAAEQYMTVKHWLGVAGWRLDSQRLKWTRQDEESGGALE